MKNIAIALVVLVLATLVMPLAYGQPASVTIMDLHYADVDWSGPAFPALPAPDNLIQNLVVGLGNTKLISVANWQAPQRVPFLKAAGVPRGEMGIQNPRETVYYKQPGEAYPNVFRVLDEGYWIKPAGGSNFAEKVNSLYDSKAILTGPSYVKTIWKSGSVELDRTLTWPAAPPFDQCVIEYEVFLNSQRVGDIGVGVLWTYERPDVTNYPNDPENALRYIQERMKSFAFTNSPTYEGITDDRVGLTIGFSFDDAMKEVELEFPVNITGLIGWDGGSLVEFLDGSIGYTNPLFSPTTGQQIDYQPSKAIWGICYLPDQPRVKVEMHNGYTQGSNWVGVGPTGQESQYVELVYGVKGISDWPPQYTSKYDPADQTIVYVSPDRSRGRNFSVDVGIYNARDLYAWQGEVKFDPTVLQCTSVEEGPFLETSLSDHVDNLEGTIRLQATRSAHAPAPEWGVNGTGVLATASFSVVELGNSSISLENLVMADSSFLPIALNATANGYYASVHDVTVEAVAVPYDEVYPRWPIDVRISNAGDYEETVNATAYLNDTIVGTSIPILLDVDADNDYIYSLPENMSLYVNYTLRVEVAPVPGETAVGDNVYIYGNILIKITGDVNCDKKVNIVDIAAAAIGFESTTGQAKYDVKTDMDLNGIINIIDIAKIATNFGRTY